MSVPYDKWGEDIRLEQIHKVIDGKDTVVGYIEDNTRYVTEPVLDKVEKKDAVNYALEFWDKYEHQWTVDDDYRVYLAYDNGTFRDVADNPEKGLNRKGLIGVYVSTPDDEMSWGGNIGRRGVFQPWSVHHEDENGDLVEVEGNYHSWYRTTGVYKVRTRTTYEKNNRGTWTPKHEIIRRSTVKEMR